MKKIERKYIGIAIIFAFSVLRCSGIENNNASLGTGFLTGNLTYQIGGLVTGSFGSGRLHFPLSELKWPINAQVLISGTDILINDSCEFKCKLMKSIRSNAAKMEDSDWTLEFLPCLKTIYSESDTEFQGYAVDTSFHLLINNQKSSFLNKPQNKYSLGLGILSQEYKWNASNVDQWYPLDASAAHEKATGLVGTYKAMLLAPYFEVTANIIKNRYVLSSSFAFAPYSEISDEDNHILRQMLSKGNSKGTGIKAGLTGQYNFTKNIFIIVQADYLALKLNGSSNTVFYEGVDKGLEWNIENKVMVTQYYWGFSIGRKF